MDDVDGAAEAEPENVSATNGSNGISLMLTRQKAHAADVSAGNTIPMMIERRLYGSVGQPSNAALKIISSFCTSYAPMSGMPETIS